MAAKRGFAKGLALQMPAAMEQSYRVDENGAFVHGQIAIGANGMVMDGSASNSMALTAEEAEDLKQMSKDTKLEDLEFLEKLGEGNSSVVHRARDRRTGVEYAVKRINIYDKSKRHQIIKELQTLYKCECPSLISFHGAFFKEGAISIALELMDVGSLADVLAVQGSIDEPELLYFARPMIEGLAYLRRKHKIHRDVKPSNVCINSAGAAKLSDFGITTSLENTLADCSSFVGTSAYMSPERLQGAAYKYPADIWAIGLVLLECAQGRFPYAMTGVYLDLMQAVISGPSPALAKQADGTYGKFSREFAHFVACCLNKDPEARATADELLLHPWLAKSPPAHMVRSPAQMASWIAGVKVKVQEKARRERAAAEGAPLPSLLATNASSSSSANAPLGASAQDPFEAGLGYNNTTTSGGNGEANQQQGRFNVPANAQSSFYSAKEIP